MKKYLFTFLASIFSLIANGQHYIAEIGKSTIEWTGYSEVGSYSQQGTIKLHSAQLNFINDTIQSCELIIDTQSISSSEKDLEKHLKKKDFFWVKKYPEASFLLSKIKGSKATGILKLRGKSQPISFYFTLNRQNNSISLSGKMTIDRTKYDINYNSSSYFQNLGSYAIKNEFDLDFDIVFVLE